MEGCKEKASHVCEYVMSTQAGIISASCRFFASSSWRGSLLHTTGRFSFFQISLQPKDQFDWCSGLWLIQCIHLWNTSTAWKWSELNLSTLMDLNTGAPAEGRGTAQKYPGAGRRKTNRAEGKVRAQHTDMSAVKWTRTMWCGLKFTFDTTVPSSGWLQWRENWRWRSYSCWTQLEDVSSNTNKTWEPRRYKGWTRRSIER